MTRVLARQDKEMVKLLLDMKAGLDTVMGEAFANDERFGHALKDAFEHFINQRANRRAHPAARLPLLRLKPSQASAAS